MFVKMKFWGDFSALYDQGKNKLGGYIHTAISEMEPTDGDLLLLSYGEEDHVQVRKELGALAPLSKDCGRKIFDLGHLAQGDEGNAILVELSARATEKGQLLVVLSNHGEVNYAMYRALEKYRRNATVSRVSANSELGNKGWVSSVIEHRPNYLFDFSFLAVQQYLEHPETLPIADEMGFDVLRLGMLRQDLKECEPYFRLADLVSFDLFSVRASDYLPSVNFRPNGLFGEELCGLARYAGYADALRLIHFGPYFKEEDTYGNGARLFSQALWYLLDGWAARTKDHPNLHHDFTTYKCELTEEKNCITFYKSKLSERWWMEVPLRKGRVETIPCTYGDYQQAAKGEMPERFFRALRKTFSR